jgi:phosphatidylglycerol:prolipoprotein diacylglycerol transferase
MDFPNINPVAFSIGPLSVHWYALAYIVGFLIGWRYILYLCNLGNDANNFRGRELVSRAQIDDFFPWAILGVVLGGRLGYMLFYQYQLVFSDPLEIFKIWQGGMSFHGGMLGMMITMIIYSSRHKLSLLHLSDVICCAAPLGLFFGRIANFINGELFGKVTEMPWGVIFPGGGDLPRHPSQLYEAGLEGLLLGVLMLVLVHVKAIRNRPGFLSGIFLIEYGTARIVVEFFREPDAHIGFLMNYFTMGQLLSVPMIIIGIILVVLSSSQLKKTHERA